MNKYLLIVAIGFCLIWGLQSAHATDEAVKDQKTTTQSPGNTKTSAPSDMQKSDPKKEEKRRAILSMRDKSLEKLYETNPEAKAEVGSSAGYAVFDASGVNIIMFVGVKGKGVAVDNSNNEIIYMQMARAGTGPGLGYKEYQLVLVFKNKKMFDEFTTIGFDAGASADATMKVGGAGVDAATAVSFNPYIKAYQITEKGLLLQANWGGTKFMKDSELNE